MADRNPFTSPRANQTEPTVSHNGRLEYGFIGIALILSAIGGALVWSLSPSLTGQLEPWDTSSGYYSIGIIIASAIGGCFAGWKIWYPMIGVFVGQTIYCFLFYDPGGPVILPLAISVAVFGLLPSLIGAVFGAVPRCVVGLFAK